MSNPFNTPIVQTGTKFISNAEYHAAEGISKSGLDLIHESASDYVWSRNAPRDNDNTDSLDFGTLLHSWLLEPDLFSSQYAVMPDGSRTLAKDRFIYEQHYSQAIADGKTPIQSADHRKVSLMRESVMAHPVARKIFELDGVNEASIFYEYEEGVLAKVRPDRMIHVGGTPTVVDLKSIAQMDRLKKHTFEYRYHVQHAMYQDGGTRHFGSKPDFIFLFVSTTLSAGRYQVKVVRLNPDIVAEGYAQYHADMAKFINCKNTGNWIEVQTI